MDCKTNPQSWYDDPNATQYTEGDIWDEDAGVFTHDNEWLRALISKAFTRIPAEDVDAIIRASRFVMLKPGDFAQVIPTGAPQDKYVVLFSESLLDLSQTRRVAIVLHEAAHVLLKHADINPAIPSASPEEYLRTEREADAKVEEWMGEEAAEYLQEREKDLAEVEETIKRSITELEHTC